MFPSSPLERTVVELVVSKKPKIVLFDQLLRLLLYAFELGGRLIIHNTDTIYVALLNIDYTSIELILWIDALSARTLSVVPRRNGALLYSVDPTLTVSLHAAQLNICADA